MVVLDNLNVSNLDIKLGGVLFIMVDACIFFYKNRWLLFVMIRAYQIKAR